MNLDPILSADPAIQLHVAAATVALVLGALVLFRRKGNAAHRVSGRIWVMSMTIVAASSFFIHEIRVIGPWSPIHLLSLATLWSLTEGVRLARRGNIALHRRMMQGTYVGGLIIAGGFTLLPGRLMHEVLLAEMPMAAVGLFAVLAASGLILRMRRTRST